MTQDPSRAVVLLGGGGHALVVADAVTEAAEILGFFDDDPNAVLGVCTGLPRLGSLTAFPDLAGPHVHLAIGNLAVRASLIERLAAHQTITIRHATAVLSASAELGRDVFVGPQAVVHTAARVGNHCIVNTGAIIEHECVLGENVHVAPGAVLGGRGARGTGHAGGFRQPRTARGAGRCRVRGGRGSGGDPRRFGRRTGRGRSGANHRLMGPIRSGHEPQPHRVREVSEHRAAGGGDGL